MCGIVGFYSKTGAPAPHEPLWGGLTDSLAHRGPDDGAYWGDGPFFLGHRRLSIIGLETGAQPMPSADGRYVIAFNGEIYNHCELRKTLQAHGCEFRTDADTEVLLHGYQRWGTDLPKHLTGMFAFAIADRLENSLFLARDRFGEKPLLVWNGPEYVAFASEMRPLAALSDLPHAVDRVALGDYLCLNYVPGERTMMADIKRLPAATSRLYRGGRCESEVYWQPEPCDLPTSMPDALDAFRERFDRAVKLTLASDVPVGIFLSGGIDSSLVAESAARQGTLTNAYVLDFAEQSHSEKGAAAMVAERLGIPLQSVALEPTADIQSLVDHADDPLADSSALPVRTISELAVQGNKVVLGGDGADELFAGYLTYHASELHRRYISRLPAPVRRSMAWAAPRLPIGGGKVSTSYKLWRFLRAAPLPTSLAHLTWNGTWLPDQVGSFMREAPETAPLSSLYGNLPSSPDLQSLQRRDQREYLCHDILAKVDRMTMSAGLECRAPFLNHDLASWACSLPQSMTYAGGTLKHLLRTAAHDIYGPEISERPKQGFSIPIHEWLRGPMRDPLTELLSEESVNATEVLAPSQVQDTLRMHLSGRRSYGWELWGLAVFVAWHRCRIQHRPELPTATSRRLTIAREFTP